MKWPVLNLLPPGISYFTCPQSVPTCGKFNFLVGIKTCPVTEPLAAPREEEPFDDPVSPPAQGVFPFPRGFNAYARGYNAHTPQTLATRSPKTSS